MPSQIHEATHPHLAPMPDSRGGNLPSPMDRKYSTRVRIPAAVAAFGTRAIPVAAAPLAIYTFLELASPPPLPSVLRHEQEEAQKKKIRGSGSIEPAHIPTPKPELRALPEGDAVIPIEGYPVISGTDIALARSVVVDLTGQYPPGSVLTWRVRVPGLREEQVITSSTEGGITVNGPVWIEDPDENPVYHMTVLPTGKTTTTDVTFEADDIENRAPVARDGYTVTRRFIHLEANPIDGERYYFEDPNLQDEVELVKKRMETVWDIYFKDLPAEKRPKIYVPSTTRAINTAEGYVILSPDLLKTHLWEEELDFKAIEYLGKYAALEIAQRNTTFADSWRLFNNTYTTYTERLGTTLRSHRSSPLDPGTPTFFEHMLKASTFEPLLAGGVDETPVIIEGGRRVPPSERVPAGLFVSIAYNSNKVIEHFGGLSSEDEQYSNKKTPEKQLYRELVFAGLNPLYQLVGEQTFLTHLPDLRRVQQAIGMTSGLGYSPTAAPESVTTPPASSSIPTK